MHQALSLGASQQPYSPKLTEARSNEMRCPESRGYLLLIKNCNHYFYMSPQQNNSCPPIDGAILEFFPLKSFFFFFLRLQWTVSVFCRNTIKCCFILSVHQLLSPPPSLCFQRPVPTSSSLKGCPWASGILRLQAQRARDAWELMYVPPALMLAITQTARLRRLKAQIPCCGLGRLLAALTLQYSIG